MPFRKSKYLNQINPLPEISHDNKVDEDIQGLLTPMRLMQYVCLMPKYDIHNKIIKPSGFSSLFICIIGTFFTVGSFIYDHLLLDAKTSYKTLSFVRKSLLFDMICYSTGFGINCIITILYRKQYVLLILKIQEAHRKLYDRKLRAFVKKNWLSAMSLLFFYFIGLSYVSFSYSGADEFFIARAIALISFDLNMVTAIRLMKFINIKLELWVKKFKIYSKICNRDGFKNKILWKNMYHTYSCLMESYILLTKVYQYLILYHVIDTFFHSMFYVQIVIDFSKLPATNRNHNLTYLIGIQVHLWLIKNLLLQGILATTFERFYATQVDAEEVSLLVESRSNSVPDISKILICKNIRRLNHLEAKKFMMCRLFLVDAKYLIRLLGLVATHSIVLLQFGYN